MRRTAWTMIFAALATLGCLAGPVRADRLRIVSFSPALTRILFDMGLGDQVVGVTTYCRPPDGAERPRVGNRQTIVADVILAVDPDLILAQNDPADFKGVRDAAPDVRIVEIEIEVLADVPAAIEQIGRLVGEVELAAAYKAFFQARLDAVRLRVAGNPRPRVLFVMGTERPITAGDDSFIHDMIELAGGVNAGADIPGEIVWRMTDIEAIVAASPDVVICQVTAAAEADDARQYWLQWQELPAARSGRVFVVTDPDWTIPSTRLAELTGELADMIHTTGQESAPSLSLWRAKALRWLAAAIVGAALATGGMALQGMLRNPLAEPYLLGISSGAGVGVLLGLAATAWWASPLWVSTPLLAFVGAIATCAAVYAIAQRRGRLDPFSLILSGVIVNTFNGAIMLVIYLYVDPNRIADFAHWAMGRLPDSVNVPLLIVCGGCMLIGWAVLLLQAAATNVMSLGDQVAASSGVAVSAVRIVTFICVGLMTAAAVALAGPIGFLGLIVPHICRMIVGPDLRVGLIASGIVGAALLVAAEGLCRFAGSLIGVSLVPVGILTAMAGGPFFIVLLRRQRGRATV